MFLIANPIAAVICFSKKSGQFFAFSINGDLIGAERDSQSTLFTPKIIKNFDEEFLAYGTEDGEILVRSLPSFKIKIKYSISETDKKGGLPIKCFEFSNDTNSIFYWQ